MADQNRIRSLGLLGHPFPVVPDNLATIHEELQTNPAVVRMNGYSNLDRLPVEEGPPWHLFEQQCLALAFSLMAKINRQPCLKPVLEALSKGRFCILPFRRSVELQSSSASTRMAGYWDAVTKRLYLDRRQLAYQITCTVGTAIHEGTHALDPTLDPTLYPGCLGFPPQVANRAEVLAFTNEGHFHADAVDYFRKQRELNASYRKWLIETHTACRKHCEMRAKMLAE